MVKKYKFIIFSVICFTLLFPLTSFSSVEIWEQPFGGHDSYNTGDMVSFSGDVYASLVDGNVWSPSTYPNGWELIENSEPGYNPEEWNQPSGAHDCYQKDAIIQFGDSYYKSLIDANVWSPAVHAAGWLKLDGVDTDNDGVDDIVELIAGTNPEDSLSTPARLSSGTLKNNTHYGSQRVEYNYSDYSGYEKSTNVSVVFPPNTISGVYLPVPFLSSANEARSNIALEENYEIDGNAIHNVSEVTYPDCGSMEKQYEMVFPISDDAQGLPKEFFKLYYDNCGTWEEIEISKVTYQGAYAPAPGAGRYYVAAYGYVYMVDDDADFVTNDEDRFHTIQEAFAKIIEFQVANPTNETKHIVCVGKGTYYCADVTVPALTTLKGGFVNKFEGISNPEEIIDRKIKDDISEIKTWKWNGTAYEPDLTKAAFEITMPYGESGVKELGIEIDGFKFDGNFQYVSNASDVTSPAGAINISCYGHLTNVNVRNCIFTKQVGTISGAVFICNASKIFFESCAFTDNRSYSGGYSIALASAPITYPSCPTCPVPPPRAPAVVDLNNISGSAVTIYEWATCGVETEFDGCVFVNNTTGFDNAQDAGDVTKLAGGTFSIIGNAGPGRAVKVLNSTFHDNNINVTLTTDSDRFAGSVLKVDADDFSANRTYSPKETPVIIMNSIMRGNLGTGTSYYDEVVGVSFDENITYWTNYEMSLNFNSDVYTYDSPTNSNDIHSTYFNTTSNVKSISNCVIGGAGLTATADANGNFDVDPLYLKTTDLDGADDEWGTSDDGLSLASNSPLRNAGTLKLLEEHAGTDPIYSNTRYYDVRNMPRIGGLDIGGYESFMNILCIGDENTRGVGTWTYRATLKQKFQELNWSIDFSGSETTSPKGNETWSETGTNGVELCRNVLEDDLGQGSSIGDIQHTSYEGANIEIFNYNDPNTFDLTTKLNSANPDLILFSAGSVDLNIIDRSGVNTIAGIDEKVQGFNALLVNISTTINTWKNSKTDERIYIQGNLPQNKITTGGTSYTYGIDDFVNRFNANIDGGNSNNIANLHDQGYEDIDFISNFTYTQSGYEKMANGWFESIYDLLRK